MPTPRRSGCNAWLCVGERLLVGRLARGARGGPLLDIGVGGGRTVGLLRLITDDYVAIDYSPQMVAAARAAHPDADIRLGDGRDLSMFGDAHFSAVVFSFNGVDNVRHEDRARIFSEMHRVLRPTACSSSAPSTRTALAGSASRGAICASVRGGSGGSCR